MNGPAIYARNGMRAKCAKIFGTDANGRAFIRQGSPGFAHRRGSGVPRGDEGILAITKALLECGVGYVGGYPGAPVSHLIDVLSDAEEILGELGVHFEANASEAAAAAMLAASVNYPIRGAVTFKGPVGANVAADALANLSSGGVTGGGRW